MQQQAPIVRVGQRVSDGSFLHLYETLPEGAEPVCPITLAPIAETAPIVVDSGKQFYAARLPTCGHHFSAMALVTYLTLNDMRCPLCRQGDANTRLSATSTFPGQAWAKDLDERAVAASAGELSTDEDENEDEEELLQHTDSTGRFLSAALDAISTVVDWMPFYAIFTLYRREDTDLIRALGFTMRPAPFQFANDLLTLTRIRYHIEPSSVRSLNETISAVRARFIRVSITVGCPSGEPVESSTSAVALPSSSPSDETFSLTLNGSDLVLQRTTITATTGDHPIASFTLVTSFHPPPSVAH